MHSRKLALLIGVGLMIVSLALPMTETQRHFVCESIKVMRRNPDPVGLTPAMAAIARDEGDSLRARLDAANAYTYIRRRARMNNKPEDLWLANGALVLALSHGDFNAAFAFGEEIRSSLTPWLLGAIARLSRPVMWRHKLSNTTFQTNLRILYLSTHPPHDGYGFEAAMGYPLDMAAKSSAPKKRPSKRGLTYADSGVSIAAGDKFVGSIGSLLRRTHGQRVIDNPGGFAGLFRLDYNEQLFKHNHKDPVLVACADGVGTKVHLAIEMNKHDTVGIDLVAMNVNDLIVQGAEPLLFLDYIAVNKVDQDVLYDIVKGISEGCRQAGCALIGGETAEMNDLYKPNDYDLAGFSVGVVELKKATNPLRVEAGDIIIGLESSGVHSNGYSLVRKVIKHAKLKLDTVYPELKTERTLGEVLLEPTRIYADSIVKLLRAYKVKKIISGMAHITGGGMEGNINRAIHDQVDAVINEKAWTPPPVFDLLQNRGDIDEAEMRVVFNMGIGYCLIVRPTFVDGVMRKLDKSGEKAHVIGKIVKGKGKVKIKNRKK